MTKISVIMSVYNDEKYISKAIESILNQTFTDFEFIIIDDCSTDSSKDIILSYAKKDQRIRFIENKKNLGLAASLNKMIRLTSCEFIARMDSDDISEKNRLEKEYQFLKHHPHYSVVASSAIKIDENENIINDFSIHRHEITLDKAIKKTPIIHPTVLMKKSALLDVGLYTENTLTKRAEDYDLWCKLLSKGYHIYSLEDKLLYYREGKDSLKKRKYKYRIEEMKIKCYWMRKEKVPFLYYLYAIKPLIVGLIPKKLIKMMKRKLYDSKDKRYI